MEGWIKLHRKINEHWVFKNAEYLKAWICILLTVNHESKTVLIHGELIECNRGQSLLSLLSWTKLFGGKWTIQKVRTFFDLLKNDSMINTEGLPKTTRLTVCNYDSYQSEQHDNNIQKTFKQHTDNTQITTNKNEKNEKNENNNNVAVKNLTAERQKMFYDSLIPFLERHGKERLKAFYNYWTEPNKSGTKMRFELERTWELSRRLNTWESREKINTKENKPSIVTIPSYE